MVMIMLLSIFTFVLGIAIGFFIGIKKVSPSKITVCFMHKLKNSSVGLSKKKQSAQYSDINFLQSKFKDAV